MKIKAGESFEVTEHTSSSEYYVRLLWSLLALLLLTR